MSAFPVPSIHMNGTPEDHLRDQLMDAMEASRNLYHALQKAAPNGRDYYLQGDDAYKLARAAHEARIQHVAAIMDDLTYMAESIQWK